MTLLSWNPSRSKLPWLNGTILKYIVDFLTFWTCKVAYSCSISLPVQPSLQLLRFWYDLVAIWYFISVSFISGFESTAFSVIGLGTTFRSEETGGLAVCFARSPMDFQRERRSSFANVNCFVVIFFNSWSILVEYSSWSKRDSRLDTEVSCFEREIISSLHWSKLWPELTFASRSGRVSIVS